MYVIPVAMLMGALVGLDRALSDTPGGMCTHALAATGACLFTQIGETSGVVMASAVLASATMFKTEHAVRGINTAISIWVAAGIGIACSRSMRIAATGATSARVAQWSNRLVLYCVERKQAER